MKKESITAIFVLVFLLTTTISAWGATLRVPSEHPTIETAITASINGDKILIDPGLYNEQIDFSGKQITVQGVAGATIEGGHRFHAITNNGMPLPTTSGFLIIDDTDDAYGDTLTINIQFSDYFEYDEPAINVTFTDSDLAGPTSYTLQEVVDAINMQSQNINTNDINGNTMNYQMASAYLDPATNTYKLKIHSRLTFTDTLEVTAMTTDSDTVITGSFFEEDNAISGVTITNGGSADTTAFVAASIELYYAKTSIAIINAPGGTGVTFDQGEGANSVLKNVIIKNSDTAISITDSSPMITNVTIVNNQDGIEAAGTSSPDISDCIVWDNSGDDLIGCSAQYSCIEDGDAGTGNISSDPCFVANSFENGYNYHLKSRARRWDLKDEIWVVDDVTSSCIDAGETTNPAGWLEPFPNAGVVNMGAYGGTDKASGSYFGGMDCSIKVAGDINGDCIINLKDFVLMADNWLVDNNP
jgi:hypothetical protein